MKFNHIKIHQNYYQIILDVSLVTNMLLVSSVHLANAASIMEILIATASWSSNTNLTAKQYEAIFGAIQGERKLNKLVL